MTKSVLTAVVATLTIVFMTFFMLLEGPDWLERIYGLLPPEASARLRHSTLKCSSPCFFNVNLAGSFGPYRRGKAWGNKRCISSRNGSNNRASNSGPFSK